ncbi:MAG: hypothetical protein Q4B71_00405 [Cardiobacteriaceae bacterium]|nr:hypothetical protein [Cardiobacteriaceae bacterium]
MSKVPQALLVVLLSACEQKAVYLDSSCYAFVPISASKRDTVETKRQILTHNQTHRELCGGADEP